MTAFLYILLGLIVVVVVVSLIWRRDALPCPTWLGWMVEMDNPFTEVNRARVIVALLELVPGMKVLDAGCGPGRLTLPLAEAIGPQGEVTALDIQDGMLARVRGKVQAAGLQNVQFVQAGLGEGKLAKDCYDRVILVTVLGEIPDRITALKEIYAALKPGGILSVTEVIFDPHFHRRGTVLHLAEQSGFKEKNFFGKRLAYTMHLEKSAQTARCIRDDKQHVRKTHDISRDMINQSRIILEKLNDRFLIRLVDITELQLNRDFRKELKMAWETTCPTEKSNA